jgi:hypothetical protein
MNPTGWRKSSYSFTEANCVEWRKSSHSNGGSVDVRDSKMAPRADHEGPAGPVLTFSPADWATFVEGIKAC